MLPILFKSSWLMLYSYPLFMGLGWGIAYQWSQQRIYKYNLQKTGFQGFFWGIFVSAWIGAKLLFLATYSGNQGISREILLVEKQFWFGGGFVFYGGMLFAVSYILIYSVKLNKYPLKNFVHFIPVVCFAHAIGRIGCFLAGCCYGVYCDLPWRVYMHGHDRHPVQIYEALLLLILGFIIDQLLKKRWATIQIIASYIGGYAFLRFFLEFFRGDKIRGVYLFGLSTSQIIALTTFIFMFGLVLNRTKQIRK